VEAAAHSGFSGTVFVEQQGSTLIDAALARADEERRRRVDHETLYHVASVTKLVTASAARMVEREGQAH
jgi:CubicO group peptidase (beta-lactamase class C family)